MGVGVGFICILLVVTLWTRAFLLISPSRRGQPIGAHLGYGDLVAFFVFL